MPKCNSFIATVETVEEMVVYDRDPELWLSPTMRQDDAAVAGPYSYNPIAVDVKSTYVIGERPTDTLVEWWYRVPNASVIVNFVPGSGSAYLRAVTTPRLVGGGGVTQPVESDLIYQENFTDYGKFFGEIEEDTPTFLRIDASVWICFTGKPTTPRGTPPLTSTEGSVYNPVDDLWLPSIAITINITVGSYQFYITSYTNDDPDSAEVLFDGSFAGITVPMIAYYPVAFDPPSDLSVSVTMDASFYAWDETFNPADGTLLKEPEIGTVPF